MSLYHRASNPGRRGAPFAHTRRLRTQRLSFSYFFLVVSLLAFSEQKMEIVRDNVNNHSTVIDSQDSDSDDKGTHTHTHTATLPQAKQKKVKQSTIRRGPKRATRSTRGGREAFSYSYCLPSLAPTAASLSSPPSSSPSSSPSSTTVSAGAMESSASFSAFHFARFTSSIAAL